MKIRIKDNSIRYRLTKGEVKTLGSNYILEAATYFPHSVFNYKIVVSEVVTHLTAEYSNNTITLLMPKADAIDWYTNEIITHEIVQVLPNGMQLKLLLEKDFVCLDHTTEDQSDNYPNPNKTC
jgi:hypothetical protein